MKLMNKGLRAKLPKLYSTSEKKAEDVTVQCKFFTPDSSWTWYATEFDGDDTFFGYVRGLEAELGYFSLKELTENTGPMGMHIERDLHFGEHTLAEVMKEQL